MFRKIIEWLVVKYNEVFFVGATDKLPPPLSKEDELKYLIRAKTGDEEKDEQLSLEACADNEVVEANKDTSLDRLVEEAQKEDIEE